MIFEIDGFCKSELKPLGPVHDHVVPALAFRFNVLPAQSGLLLAARAVNEGLITTLVVVVVVHPAALVTLTLYKPPEFVFTLLMTGFCWNDENPFGPVQ